MIGGTELQAQGLISKETQQLTSLLTCCTYIAGATIVHILQELQYIYCRSYNRCTELQKSYSLSDWNLEFYTLHLAYFTDCRACYTSLAAQNFKQLLIKSLTYFSYCTLHIFLSQHLTYCWAYHTSLAAQRDNQLLIKSLRHFTNWILHIAFYMLFLSHILHIAGPTAPRRPHSVTNNYSSNHWHFLQIAFYRLLFWHILHIAGPTAPRWPHIVTNNYSSIYWHI